MKRKLILVEVKSDRADELNKKGSFAPLIEKIARGCNVGYISADGKKAEAFQIEKNK